MNSAVLSTTLFLATEQNLWSHFELKRNPPKLVWYRRLLICEVSQKHEPLPVKGATIIKGCPHPMSSPWSSAERLQI